MSSGILRHDFVGYRTLALGLAALLGLAAPGVHAQTDLQPVPPSVENQVSLNGEVDGTLHGVLIAKSCISPLKRGDTTSCDIIVGYDDDFGDTLMIVSAFDTVDPDGDAVRVPDVGDLEIVAVSGNTTAVVGGLLPVNIGPGGSVLGGLPGNAEPGIVTFRQNTYVIQPDDPDPLPDRASVLIIDLCDDPSTEGCSSIPNLVQFTASTDLISPQIDVEKTADPTTLCLGEATPIDYTYVVTHGPDGDVALENVVLVDPDCAPIVGPISGDVDNNGILDLAEVFIDLNGNGVWDPGEPIIADNGNGVWDDTEVWTYTCTAVLSDTLTNTVTATANAIGAPECTTEDTAQATVTAFPLPVAAPVGATVCEGETAELCANPSEGVPPYTYSWTGPGGFTSTDECITVGVAGSYCVVVTDANGCMSPEACATLTVNPPPPCTITPPPVICEGGTGVFTGPAGPGLGYQWSTTCGTIVGAATNATVTIDFGAPGPCTVSVMITDLATGCTSMCSIPVTVNENPIVNPGDDAICAGEGPGEICANASGGQAPYTYMWTGPGGFVGITPCIDVSLPGIYVVTVTDANGCTASGSADLAVFPNPTANPNDDEFCAGSGPGELCANAAGGTPPYTYAWTGPGGFAAATECIDVTDAGTYTVVVTDANGCSDTETADVTIFENPIADPDDASFCAGTGPAEICANTSAGTAPYTYAWTGPGGFTAATECIDVTVAGTYTVTVTDQNGCTDTASATLTIFPNPTANPIDESFCAGSGPGEICANASGGTGPYTYSWSGPGGFFAATECIDVSVAGTYTVTVTDQNGCTDTGSATLTIFPNPLANPNDDAFCAGSGPGELCANASSGTPPYTYAWTGPGGFVAATECIDVTDAGTYTVVVTDANGCTDTESATLTIFENPVAAPSDTAFCDGEGPGQLCANASGGQAPYTYMWTGPGGFTAITGCVNVVQAGSYTVVVTDANGCTDTASATLTIYENPLANPDDAAFCAGTGPAQICANASGGTPPYAYSWTGPGGFIGATDCIDASVAGTYAVLVTDANGCTATGTSSVVIYQNPVATPSGDEFCEGEGPGQICANAFGGTPPYTYAWTGPGGFAASTACIDVSVAGDYCVTVTDANGCVSPEACAPLVIDALPACTIDGPMGSICADSSGVFTGPAGPGLAYQWSTDCGSIVGPSTTPSVMVNFGAAGACTVTLTTTDLATGCTNTCNIPVVVNENPVADPADIEVCVGEAGEICANASGGTGPYTYEWTGPGGFSSTDACVTVDAVGTYCVTVTDAIGCVAVTECAQLTNSPLPLCGITGPTLVTAGEINMYSGTPGFASYLWTVTGDGTIVGPNDQESVQVRAGLPPATLYAVALTVTDANGCVGACDPLSIEINVPGRCCLPGPFGAACIDTVNVAECTALGGTGFTPLETCDILPCGACCLNTPLGACIDRVSPDECAAAGGDPATYTPNAFCADIVCSGACCFEDGTCMVVMSEADCDALPGSTGFLPNASCVPNPCELDEPGWNYVDNVITLTGDQPTYWSAFSGLPATGGVAPFVSLDPGFPPGRPAMDGTNDRVLRGLILAWAVNSTADDEIDWNHLKGEGTIVNYRDGYAWEYGSWNFRADPNGITTIGDVLGDGPGNLQIDGFSYECAPQQLLINFQAAGSSGFSGPRQIVSGSDLTLHPVDADLRQEGDGPVTTKANFNIWNENEVKFSGTHRCITCWDQTELADFGFPNSFLLMHLQTPHGKARVDGLESQVCDVDVDFTDGPLGAHPNDVISQEAALLGVIRRLLTIDGGLDMAAAGTNLIGLGQEMASIEYDTTGVPPEGVCTGQATHSEKGSLLIFSNVELRWDQNGALIQDTFISLTNDYPEDVKVQLYFINGDAPIDTTAPATGGDIDDDLGRLLDVLQSFDPDEDRDALRQRLDDVLEELAP